ncbi:MBL fold metallo-hydrolase [Ruminococcus flavefaciens]|uniref:Glyoxylase, beta-lactamase superfamily II n=1 Tax=Ruminococcus flavefaciens TaxID=1265 RepID=A0A1M7IIP2_RUMFL|nr:MBL fold metallo-hydrolase [Ruminococcus flavefaciens]SHM40696.1 Glyoxylase, beta-lactamase superfamily II [Ruminococcus flavefaciens]
MKYTTEHNMKFGGIHYFCAEILGSPVTCYVLRGREGDLLIDTGIPFMYKALAEYLSHFDIRYILLTHAHVDHDSNAERLRKSFNAEILLGERDRELIGHYGRQPVHATLRRYKLRNIQQNVCGRMKLFSTKPYTPDILLSSHNTGALRELGFDADVVMLAGHTLGSVGVLSNGVLYCGDAFTAMWGKPDITPHAASLKAMAKSLEKILDISPQWLACGHGLPVKMRDARPVIKKYLFSKRESLLK